MAAQAGTPFVIRRRMGGAWKEYVPKTDAGQILMPNGSALSSYMAVREPDQKLVTINHELNGYPLILLLSLQYGAGLGGAGAVGAGGTDPVQYPCRAVYHSRNSLTVYTIKAITDLGNTKTLNKVSGCEYMVTFGGISVDSMYVKLLLNMGGTSSTVPAQLYLTQEG